MTDTDPPDDHVEPIEALRPKKILDAGFLMLDPPAHVFRRWRLTIQHLASGI
jgi:hypothetical protein